MSPPPSRWKLAVVMAALPALAIGLCLELEGLVQGGSAVCARDPAKVEALKAAIAMDVDLAKWFIGLASSVIAGVLVYVKAGPQPQPALRPFSLWAAGLALGAAVLSILFGHLWQAGLRNVYALNCLDRSLLFWPERLQYLCFIVSLVWFALLMIERESAPRPVPAASAAAPVPAGGHEDPASG